LRDEVFKSVMSSIARPGSLIGSPLTPQRTSPFYRLVTENQGESLVIASNNGVWDDYKNQFSERIIIVSKPVDN
jgi:hypothetical protein